MEHLKHDGITANFLQFVTILPFPEKLAEQTLGAAQRTLLVENNRNGQLGGVIREYTGIATPDRFLKYDGRPIYPEEIVQRAKEVLHG